MNKTGSSMRRGFTLVEVMVVVTIILIIVCIAVPGLRRYRRVGLAQRCIANLRMIQHARESYFFDHPTATQLLDVRALEPYLPLNLALNEQYSDITCVGSSYTLECGVTDLSVLPTCPHLNSTDIQTDDLLEYGEHVIPTLTN